MQKELIDFLNENKQVEKISLKVTFVSDKTDISECELSRETILGSSNIGLDILGYAINQIIRNITNDCGLYEHLEKNPQIYKIIFRISFIETNFEENSKIYEMSTTELKQSNIDIFGKNVHETVMFLIENY